METFNAGRFVWQGSYKSFIPEEINREWPLIDMEIISLLSKADRELGRLDMYSEHTPNIDLFISMHVVKESTQSNKIEGTKTTIEEALLEKEALYEEKRNDWEEVQNYIKALRVAIDALKELPISSRLIKLTHKELLKGVRGKHKTPGEYRNSQNWIGGSSVSDAVFIPPPHTEVPRLMGDLEKFIHNTELQLPHLLKIALIHYQFETIHPFLDGNGRVGRLLITLYLVEKGILKQPVLYLSDFFEKNRSLYYDNLMRVRTSNDIKQWIKFFLVGVIETAKGSIRTFDQIMKLQKEVDSMLQGLGARAGNAKVVVHRLYHHPLTDAKQVSEQTGLSLPSSYTLISELEQMGILKEITGAKRGKLFMFNRYIELFK